MGGDTPKQVSDILLCSESSVRTYWNNFLTEEQEQELSQHLEENLYQRSQENRQSIAKKYNVKYSYSIFGESRYGEAKVV
jgi:hypothetical protein